MKLLKWSAAIVFFLSTHVNAALVERLNGLAFYDTETDLTWLADANYAMTSGYDADGRMDWANAVNWVTNLNIAGISDWRLAYDGGCYAYTCTNNEMAGLFYNTLGNTAGSLSNTGPFYNVQASSYWIGLTYDYGNVWQSVFNMAYGETWESTRGENNYVWVVNDGDIGGAVSTVPVPAAVWLFGSGLLGLAGIARRYKA